MLLQHFSYKNKRLCSKYCQKQYVKSVRFRSFSGQYFPVFRLNMEERSYTSEFRTFKRSYLERYRITKISMDATHINSRKQIQLLFL